jgi:hypothetical protein
MAYRLFSTDNADYVLQLGQHTIINPHTTFPKVDAIVIETGSKRLNDYLDVNHLQFQMPLDFCKDNQIPAFGTDVNINLSRAYFAEFLILPLNYMMGNDSFAKNQVNETRYSFFSFISQTLLTEARNATNARNVEEFVVPRVREISGKEKPKIGLVYGLAHFGLENCLKSKKRRDFTIWNYRNFNFRKYSGLDREKLNQVDEANFDGESWQITEHPTNLFD